MLRTVMAVVAGMVALVLVVALVEMLGHVVYPPPPNVDMTDPDQLNAMIGQLPTGALVSVVMAWALGSLAGGFVAHRVANRHRLMAALIVGGIMLALVIANLLMIPHPAWMTVAGLALPLPLAWLGARIAALGSRRTVTPVG